MSGASPYPISRLISDLIIEHSSSEDELVSRILGYHDLAKGGVKLRRWLYDGEGSNSVIKAIAWATQRGPELQEAIAVTRQIKAAEYEAAWVEDCRAEAATFRPFLCAVGKQSVPNGICIFGMTGGHRRWTIVQVPGTVLDLPLEKQITTLPQYMQKYKTKFGGQVPFFGQLTGFKFVRLLDHLRFDAEGVFVEHVERPFRLVKHFTS